MTIRGPERTVRASVWDRLITDKRNPSPSSMTFDESVRQMKMALLRDLEWLLNTRKIPKADRASDAYPELQRSVYHYGLADTIEQREGPKNLQREIEECLRLFEPRLTSVNVTQVMPAEGETRFDVRFTIEALLRMEPNPERVVFDTVLDKSNHEFSVAGSNA